MHFEPRSWVLTKALRLGSGWCVLTGLLAVGFGVVRLGLLGWLMGKVFAGEEVASLALPIALIALVMVLRGVFEHWRVMVAHETAARVQKRLRRAIYDRIAALGPGAIGRRRPGALTSSPLAGGEARRTS